jgi:predicted ATPase with chaperone activity
LFVKTLPFKRIVVILASADLLREGVHFDLPISFGLFLAIGVVPWVLSAFLGHYHLDIL